VPSYIIAHSDVLAIEIYTPNHVPGAEFGGYGGRYLAFIVSAVRGGSTVR